MNGRSAALWGLVAVAIVAVLLVRPLVDDSDAHPAAFDAYIQSGTCAQPTADFKTDVESESGDNDVEPYVAVGANGDPVTLGYQGAAGVPGFGVAAIYTDQRYSLVITGAGADDAVACGDILRPDADRFGDAGVAVVQVLPVRASDAAATSPGVQGVAVIERATLQRELVVTPTRVRILLTTDPVSVPADAAPGYDGYVQGGPCGSPTGKVRVDLKSESDYDVKPFKAHAADTGASVTVASYGSSGTPGFGLAATSTDQDFSLVLTNGGSGEPAACGDILEPDDDDFVDAGLALVRLDSTGAAEAQGGTGAAAIRGYAIVDRVELQRELDVTPTLVRVLLFAPPATAT